MRILLRLATLLATVSATLCHASDLGTAGVFRSIGGASCPSNVSNGCAPPPVDVSLPRDQQVRAQVARALALLDLVRVGDARLALADALRLDPNDPEALTLRGRLALSNGDVEGARVDIDHALLLAPQDPNLLATHGAIVSSACNCAQGLDELASALKVQPRNVDALFIRATLYLSEHAAELAFGDLTSILEFAPGDVRARLLRAKVQAMRNDFELAIFDAGQVIGTQPMNTEALLIRATARVNAGDDLGALQDYNALLDQAGAARALFIPQFRNAMLARARLEVKLGHAADASRDVDAILNQGGQKAVLRLQLYLQNHGFPNMQITGARSASFDTALAACFANKACGPDLKP